MKDHSLDSLNGDCIIDAGWALTEVDGRQQLVENASIVVRGNTIIEISDRKPGTSSENRVDATNMLVLPGFISTHTHTGQSSPARGLIEGGRFMDRPTVLVEDLDDDQMDLLTAYNIAEVLKSGCTTIVEMSGTVRQAESFIRVAKQWGVRAYVSVIAPNISRLHKIWYRDDDQVLFDSVPETLEEIETARQLGLRLKAEDDELLKPQMGAHAADTHTPETLRAVLKVAEELGNGIHIHVSQREREVEAVKRLWGMRPVEWLESLGIFSLPTIAAHLYKMDTVLDPPILKRNDVTFAHCACMASILHQASQPLPEALAAGINVGLGLDQISNDYVENIKMATFNGQLRTNLLQDHSAAGMQKPEITDTVYAATAGGANALRREDLGRLVVGAKADLCAVDISGPLVGLGSLPPDPLNHLLYMNGLSVRFVMVNGKFKVYHGELVAADEEQVIQDGGAMHRLIWSNLENENWFNAAPPKNSRG